MVSIFFMGLLIIFYLLWGNVYLGSFLIFKSSFLVFFCFCFSFLFLILSSRRFLHVLGINLLSDIWFAKNHIFSCALYFYPVDSVFLCTNFENFMTSNLSGVFCCCFLCFWCHPSKINAKSSVVKFSFYVFF